MYNVAQGILQWNDGSYLKLIKSKLKPQTNRSQNVLEYHEVEWSRNSSYIFLLLWQSIVTKGNLRKGLFGVHTPEL